MRATYVVIYQLNTGIVYGWFCKAESAPRAKQEFRQEVMVIPDGVTIKCVCELQSNVIDAYFSLYERAGDA